jgi:hypothetical protein
MSFGTFTVQNDIIAGAKNDAVASEQLTLLLAQSNAYGKRTHNFAGGASCPPVRGQNGIIFGTEVHAYTKATHILSVNIVLPRGSIFPILCYLHV